MSFLRHADLSPDVSGFRDQLKPGGRQNLSSPRATHRYDESCQVFLAGCSPAEPASAFLAPSIVSNSTHRSKPISENGPLLLCRLSHSRGAPQAECRVLTADCSFIASPCPASLPRARVESNVKSGRGLLPRWRPRESNRGFRDGQNPRGRHGREMRAGHPNNSQC
jgi:hypothetical protein